MVTSNEVGDLRWQVAEDTRPEKPHRRGQFGQEHLWRVLGLVLEEFLEYPLEQFEYADTPLRRPRDAVVEGAPNVLRRDNSTLRVRHIVRHLG